MYLLEKKQFQLNSDYIVLFNFLGLITFKNQPISILTCVACNIIKKDLHIELFLF